MSFHHVGRALPGHLLFTSHVEAALLWQSVLRRVPAPLALCLMPDHVHLLASADLRVIFGEAMRAFAKARNARRGIRGPVWRRQDSPEEVRAGLKERRSVRYIHLNPCRAGLVSDPLAWPWSTHRDRCGLVVDGAGGRHRDPVAFHRYVSSDPSVRVDGSFLPLPVDLVEAGVHGLERLREAVSEVSRRPLALFDVRGHHRDLWIRCARLHSSSTSSQIARVAEVTARTVRNQDRRSDRRSEVVARAAGDLARFPGLVPGDLRQLVTWRRYLRFA